MSRFRSFSASEEEGEGINMSPMIDCVFILLIFFIVTTTFVEETGVEVDKPQAASAARLEKTSDPEIQTRINAYEMAFRMQTSAPELMDLSKESAAMLEFYGVKPGEGGFAANALLARRMIERGVRFVQLYHTDYRSL